MTKKKEVPQVSFKINPSNLRKFFSVSNSGRQVSIPEKEYKYIQDAFKRYDKAQLLLEKYYYFQK